ncbi:hypothetical protein GGTG_04411 [Gaeumannomyces tritici R3-111a-1]|uniref:Uncharacterized protein n=1 Tax=Gaeumannomyces tritici (strain R3-111a-1) TaxID=644352 RepID=J3NT13_GAET3|nr:hypothetical protein GGTG_04411 [Gaeumannomyces tritici R3-111a-1]EJT79326.1 hypothetical protein GGTG_04411 [Gaeumannomyces tritici R3-111a-1]
MFGISCSKKPAKCVKCPNCTKAFNGRLKVNGVLLHTRYCSGCFCRSVAGGRACSKPRIGAVRRGGLVYAGDLVPDVPWCIDHITCSDLSVAGGHCRRIVKQCNPAKFSFCEARKRPP